MHVAIVDPNTGNVASKVYDTYSNSSKFEEFIANAIPDGFIVVCACKDDCFLKLSDKCKQWFINMGSKEISNLKYR